MSTTGINCPQCGSPYIEKAQIGYRCTACSTEFVVHSEEKKMVTYDLPPYVIKPPKHMIADGDVVRCTMCGKLYKNEYGASHWCGDYHNNIEHSFVWFNMVKLAKRCKSCGCWTHPSFDHCSNQQCDEFGSSPTLYVQKEVDGRWEEYTPVPDPPPAPQIEAPEEKKNGCGCLTFSVPTTVIAIMIIAVFWFGNVVRFNLAAYAATREVFSNSALYKGVSDDDYVQKKIDGHGANIEFVETRNYTEWGYIDNLDTKTVEIVTMVKPQKRGEFAEFKVVSTWIKRGKDNWFEYRTIIE